MSLDSMCIAGVNWVQARVIWILGPHNVWPLGGPRLPNTYIIIRFTGRNSWSHVLLLRKVAVPFKCRPMPHKLLPLEEWTDIFPNPNIPEENTGRESVNLSFHWLKWKWFALIYSCGRVCSTSWIITGKIDPRESQKSLFHKLLVVFTMVDWRWLTPNTVTTPLNAFKGQNDRQDFYFLHFFFFF